MSKLLGLLSVSNMHA